MRVTGVVIALLLTTAISSCFFAAAKQAHDDLTCHEYTVEPPPELHEQELISPIIVPDEFYIESASVELNLHHRRVGALTISVSKTSMDNDTTVMLKQHGPGRLGNDLAQTIFIDSAERQFPSSKEAAPFRGMFKPAQPLSAFRGLESKGMWLIRIEDVKDEPERRPMIISSWTLVLCENKTKQADSQQVMTDDDRELVASIAQALAQDVENAFWEATVNDQERSTVSAAHETTWQSNATRDESHPADEEQLQSPLEQDTTKSHSLPDGVLGALLSSNASDPFENDDAGRAAPAIQAQSGYSAGSAYLPMAGWPYAQATRDSHHVALETASHHHPAKMIGVGPVPLLHVIKVAYGAAVEQYQSAAKALGTTLGSVVASNYLLKSQLYSILFTPSSFSFHQRLKTVFGLLKTPKYKLVRIQFALAALTTGYALTLLDPSGLRSSVAVSFPELEDFLESVQDTAEEMPLVMEEWDSMQNLITKMKNIYEDIKKKYGDNGNDIDGDSWREDVKSIIKGGALHSGRVVDEFAADDGAAATMETVLRSAIDSGINYLLGAMADNDK